MATALSTSPVATALCTSAVADTKDQEDAFSFGERVSSGKDLPQVTQTPVHTKLVFDAYDFNYPRRGKCVIVNNQHFDTKLTGQLDRDGTEVDADAVERLFLYLGFEVVRFNDLNSLDFSVQLKQVALEDHSEADCFVCIILSHGEEGYVYGTTGKVMLHKIIDSFKGEVCPTLAGKPKLFFIQACRGHRYDWGVEVADAGDEPDALVEPMNVRKIPIEADVLIAYSVVPGYFSWRNNVDGSWFMQALVRVFTECAEKCDVIKMLTLVNKVVAYEFESCTDEDFTTGMKQVPCFTSTLTKEVYLTPKYQ